MANPLKTYERERPASGSGFISVTERQLDQHTAEIAVTGELDLATAPHLKWPLLDSLKAGRTRLLVNLDQVTFIDSTALSVLVGAHRKLPQNARMAIVASNENVLRIFTVAGLDAVFAIFADSALALQYLLDTSTLTESQTAARTSRN